MTENTLQAYEKFAAHITHETNNARRMVDKWITDRRIESIGCVDELTQKGAVNPPGGGMFLQNEGLLEGFLYARRGLSGQIYVHDFCGYMRVIMGLQTLDEQQRAIDQFREELDELQIKYGTNFSLTIEHNGSAKPYTSG